MDQHIRLHLTAVIAERAGQKIARAVFLRHVLGESALVNEAGVASWFTTDMFFYSGMGLHMHGKSAGETFNGTAAFLWTDIISLFRSCVLSGLSHPDGVPVRGSEPSSF
jgi:hypothetical protein